MQNGPLSMAQSGTHGNMSRNYAFFFSGGAQEAAASGVARISVIKTSAQLRKFNKGAEEGKW